ncbi:response regulator transcription factor [Clostridioides sp. ES-S-0001-03]|uniref:response regulator transcription factor n=1 Tax=Clostridioides sp. ES-S-0001-03 TaxID=2770771 RepID=UPI001D0C9062|nr:response regulator transcription factor [Clostridioides sp. ES-S-0001-03]
METYFDKKILLVDDEKDIINLIEEVLIKDGFKNIVKAYNGLDAISLCKIECPDVVILDIMLPDVDGIEVCKKIREFSYCSILFLSSKDDDIDKILGLSSGGDDYITKPFSPREVVFRVKSQLRRQQYQSVVSSENPIIRLGNITVDTEGCRVYKDANEIELTGREYQLLSYMAQNLNKIIGKESLYEQVWGVYSSICDNTIMVHIRHLREKIEDNPSNPKILITVKGLGYKLVNRVD